MPIQCLPNIVPTTDNGSDTNSQMPSILRNTENGMALIVSYEIAIEFRTEVTATTQAGRSRILHNIARCHCELLSERVVGKYCLPLRIPVHRRRHGVRI